MALYLITEEWDESDQLPNGGGTSYVYAHGNVSRRQAKKIVADMEAYSPHDYVDSMEYETKKEYDAVTTSSTDLRMGGNGGNE